MAQRRRRRTQRRARRLAGYAGFTVSPFTIALGLGAAALALYAFAGSTPVDASTDSGPNLLTSAGDALATGFDTLTTSAADVAAQALGPNAQWALDVWRASKRVLPDLSPSARMLLVAHGAYESGFGAATAAKLGFNVFNITAGGAWHGPTFTEEKGDWLYKSDGSRVRVTQVWRVYGSLDEAITDYWAFLNGNGGRYASAVLALENGDLPAFAQALGSSGYYTLPINAYTAGLTARLADVTSSLAVRLPEKKLRSPRWEGGRSERSRARNWPVSLNQEQLAQLGSPAMVATPLAWRSRR